jgi:hypothetical protein
LTLLINPANSPPGKYFSKIKLAWPNKDGSFCQGEYTVILGVITPNSTVKVPSIDPRGSSVLTYALDLVKSGWEQGASARDINNNPLKDPKDPLAVKWCLTGAIEVAKDYHSDKGRYLISQGEFIIPTLQIAAGGVTDLSKWNDSPNTTREDVIEALLNARNLMSSQIQRVGDYRDGIVKSVNDTLPPLVLNIEV